MNMDDFMDYLEYLASNGKTLNEYGEEVNIDSENILKRKISYGEDNEEE